MTGVVFYIVIEEVSFTVPPNPSTTVTTQSTTSFGEAKLESRERELPVPTCVPPISQEKASTRVDVSPSASEEATVQVNVESVYACPPRPELAIEIELITGARLSNTTEAVPGFVSPKESITDAVQLTCSLGKTETFDRSNGSYKSFHSHSRYKKLSQNFIRIKDGRCTSQKIIIIHLTPFGEMVTEETSGAEFFNRIETLHIHQ